MTTDTSPRLTMADFIAARDITAHLEPVDERPGASGWDFTDHASHYRYELAGPERPRRMSGYWSQGPALRDLPTAAEILTCLLDEASTVEDCDDAWDMGDAYGMPHDTPKEHRQVEATWRALVRQRDRLRRWLGDEYEHALYNVDRSE